MQWADPGPTQRDRVRDYLQMLEDCLLDGGELRGQVKGLLFRTIGRGTK